jgi:hypothetical protein
MRARRRDRGPRDPRWSRIIVNFSMRAYIYAYRMRFICRSYFSEIGAFTCIITKLFVSTVGPNIKIINFFITKTHARTQFQFPCMPSARPHVVLWTFKIMVGLASAVGPRADSEVQVLARWAIFGPFRTLSLEALTPLLPVLEIEPFLGRFFFSAPTIWLLCFHLNSQAQLPRPVRVIMFLVWALQKSPLPVMFWHPTALRCTIVGMLARQGQNATASERSWSRKKALL